MRLEWNKKCKNKIVSKINMHTDVQMIYIIEINRLFRQTAGKKWNNKELDMRKQDRTYKMSACCLSDR